jgi:hypothetical protein
MIITFAALAAHPQFDDITDYDPADLHVDPDNTPISHVRDTIDPPVTPLLRAYLDTELGYRWTDDHVEFDPDKLDDVNAIWNAVATEYDHLEFDHPEWDYPNHPPTWAKFELGGDDDVDYNSSLPSLITDLIYIMIDREPIQKRVPWWPDDLVIAD